MVSDSVRWLRSAYDAALRSPDLSNQIGVYLIGIGGNRTVSACNDFTEGFDPQPEHFARPLKYTFTEHAERNAIYRAAHWGIRPHTLAVTRGPCADCARGVVQSGIKVLVRHKREDMSHWSDSIAAGDEMMRAGGVEILEYEGLLGGCAPILVDGKRWIP